MKWFAFSILALVSVVALAACGTAKETQSDAPAAAPAETVTVVEKQPAPAKAQPAPAKAQPAPAAPAETVSQENASASAKSYLDTMPFSRSGLIEQLEYEGFTHAQSVYGVTRRASSPRAGSHPAVAR